MTDDELIHELEVLNVASKFYSILGHPKEYAYNLEFVNSQYNVFYLERGERIYQKSFSNIEEANQYLFDMIKVNIDYGLNLSK